jgi:hypothetical protein
MRLAAANNIIYLHIYIYTYIHIYIYIYTYTCIFIYLHVFVMRLAAFYIFLLCGLQLFIYSFYTYMLKGSESRLFVLLMSCAIVPQIMGELECVERLSKFPGGGDECVREVIRKMRQAALSQVDARALSIHIDGLDFDDKVKHDMHVAIYADPISRSSQQDYTQLLNYFTQDPLGLRYG